MVRLVDGVTRAIDWPEFEVHAVRIPRAPRDLVLLSGPEPAMKWRTFSRTVVDLAEALGIQMAVLLGALLAGAISAYLIARFLGLILAGEREMDPAEYRLVGTVGRISVSVPAGGTGEVIFSKAGARRSEAARGLEGRPIARGTEVVITAYQDGFAIVQPWDEFLGVEERHNA
jgi:membrane protein implicated in regulation of membrane protease activity